MKRAIAIGCVALTGMLFVSSEAKADRFRISFGNSCNSGFYGGGFVGRSYGYSGYSPYSYSGYSGLHRTWHDTSHYDYHPPTVYRHRNHYHVTPGHYDLHRTGHWDYHHH